MKSNSIFSYVSKFELCDRNHFFILKGIAILTALIAWFSGAYLGFPYAQIIIKSVAALFVLCSGFGVSESYSKKRGLFHYWENKIIKVWLPSMVLLIALALIEGKHFISWIPKYPLALKGNLMYVIFGEYLVFWCVFKFIPNKTAQILSLFGCSVIAFIFLPETISIKAHVFCFPVGVLFSQMGWKRKIRVYAWKGKVLLLLSCFAVGAAAWFAANWVTIPYLNTLIWSVFFMAAAASLCFLVWILKKIPVFGIFVPAGMASYMLFLLYDSVFRLVKNNDNWRSLILVVVVLFAAAGLLTWLRDLLVIWNKNMRRRGKTQLKGSM